MNLTSFFSQFSRAVVQAAADAQQQQGIRRAGGGGKGKGPECTPCAAEAQVASYKKAGKLYGAGKNAPKTPRRK